MSFFIWLAESALGHAIRESLWLYPTMLSLHAVGMTVVVGLLLMIDLRVLGFAKAIPMPSLDRLYTVAWIGFILNLLSGSMLFAGDAPRFVTSVPFIIKIVCIVIGGVLAWLLARAVAAAPGDGSGAMPGNARAIAAISMIVWVTAITSGRLTAYIMTGDTP